MFLKKNIYHIYSNPVVKTYFLKDEGPINLIEFRRDKLFLNEDAVKILNDIKDNIIIVSVFGKGHTGKSFLMNLLLNSRENAESLRGFKVNSSITSSKRGIWMWNTPIQREKSSEKIIFIDSEGINSENIYHQSADSKLFALMIMISSLFIYNTVGDINSNSLNDLELIVHLVDLLTVDDTINKEQLISDLCPKFIWALRDFDLEKMKNKDGKKISSDDYLEQCLIDRFEGKNKDEINLIKDYFLKYFKERECVALPSPVEDEKDLIMLKRMNFKDLRQDFKNEFKNLRNKIYKFSSSKIINGNNLNGPMIAYILTNFIKLINDEKTINISNIFNEMSLYDIDNQYNYVKNLFKKKLQELKEEELDLDIKELYSFKYECLKEYMTILENNPEIYKKEIYLKEYNTKKEKLEKELEKMINQELSILLSDNTYENFLTDIENNNKKNKNTKKIYKNSEELIEDYFNYLSEFKINSTISIFNNKAFDSFIIDDIKKTKNIIDFMEKNNEFSSKKKININEDIKTKINTDNDKEYENLKTELETNEKVALELIGRYTNLMEKRDKYMKNSFRASSSHMKRGIKSYSSKLVNSYFKEENVCELSSEEKSSSSNCHCDFDSLKNCNIF